MTEEFNDSPYEIQTKKAECPRDQDNTDEVLDVIFWIGTIGERKCVLHMESTCCLYVFLYLITKKGKDSKMETWK